MKQLQACISTILISLFFTSLAIADVSSEVDPFAEPLPAEEAFIPAASQVDDNTVELRWTIADGYYMYRSKFQFQSQTPGVSLGEPAFPKGKIKKDEFFGEVETYRKQVAITVPVQRASGQAKEVEIATVSQGCADIGVCYQPQKRTVKVALSAAAGGDGGKPALKKLGDLGNDLGLGQPEYLKPDEAFIFSSEVVDGNTIKARWDIADGYYLYKEKFNFKVAPDELLIENVALPKGEMKVDEAFGEMEVYHNSVEAIITLNKESAAKFQNVSFQAGYQGCAEAGFCYAPMKASSDLNLAMAGSSGPGDSGGPGLVGRVFDSVVGFFTGIYNFITDTGQLRSILSGGNYAVVVPLFFGLGLLLAFTPCVFPMVPILSSIIAGEGDNVTTRRAFTMSLVYVLAMAVTYTTLGVFAGMAGQALDAMFQNPWVLSVFAGVFVLLSLSMFGYYDLQLPSSWQSRLTEISNKQQGGKLAGVGVMGFLSALIVGPCVAAPLAAVILLIAEQQDPVYGAAVLFSMTLGMGAPLLLIGTAAGRYLPRAGGWMEVVKGVFGIMLLGLAVYFLNRFIQPPTITYIWIAWIIFSVIYLSEKVQLKPDAGWGKKLNKYGWIGGAALLSFFLFVGLQNNYTPGGGTAVTQQTGDPSGTPSKTYRKFDSVAGMPVVKVKGLEYTMEVIKEANAQGKGVFIDIFADWCTYCRQMDNTTFADKRVQDKLKNFVMIKVDITDDDKINRELRKHYNLITPPPVYMFFDTNGKEIKSARMYGYKNADQFLRKLQIANLQFAKGDA